MASVTPVVTDAATLEEVMDVLEEHMPIKWEAKPGDPRRTDKCPSILSKLAENAIDNDMGFW
jgi:hypothetical protein